MIHGATFLEFFSQSSNSQGKIVSITTKENGLNAAAGFGTLSFHAN